VITGGRPYPLSCEPCPLTGRTHGNVTQLTCWDARSGSVYGPSAEALIRTLGSWKTPRADGKPNTTRLWVYNFRTGKHYTLKQRPLRCADLDEFVEAYHQEE